MGGVKNGLRGPLHCSTARDGGGGFGVQIKYFLEKTPQWGGGKDPPMGGYWLGGVQPPSGGVNPPLGGICINPWCTVRLHIIMTVSHEW